MSQAADGASPRVWSAGCRSTRGDEGPRPGAAPSRTNPPMAMAPARPRYAQVPNIQVERAAPRRTSVEAADVMRPDQRAGRGGPVLDLKRLMLLGMPPKCTRLGGGRNFPPRDAWRRLAWITEYLAAIFWDKRP